MPARQREAAMAAQGGRSGGEDALGLMVRWGALVVALVVGGLLLASRAGDDYTAAFGFLLAGFGAVLGFRVLARVLP